MTELAPSEALRQLAASYAVSQALCVVAELDLARWFAEAPRSCGEVAEAAGLHEETLFRLVRSLTDAGVFVDAGARRFGLGPLGRCLLDGAPEPMREAVISLCEPYRAAADLLDAVRTGERSYERSGAPGVDRALAGRALVEAVDLGAVKILAAPWGDDGLLGPIREAYPALRSCDRLVPEVELVVLDHALSRLEDERAVMLLADLRPNLPAGARLVAVEWLIPRGDAPSFGRLHDLILLASSSGRERTEAEYAALFAAAGFDLACVIPTRAGPCVLEALPT